MKLGRILRESLEGAVPRLVVAQPEYERVIDLASAEYQRLLATGASAEAARRLASALYPGSMSAAIAAGPTLRPTKRSLQGIPTTLELAGRALARVGGGCVLAQLIQRVAGGLHAIGRALLVASLIALVGLIAVGARRGRRLRQPVGRI